MTDIIKSANLDTETPPHTQGKQNVKMKAEIWVMPLPAKAYQSQPANHQKPEERPGAAFPSCQKEPTLLTPSSQTASLRSCEVIHFFHESTQFVVLCNGSPSKPIQQDRKRKRKSERQESP